MLSLDNLLTETFTCGWGISFTHNPTLGNYEAALNGVLTSRGSIDFFRAALTPALALRAALDHAYDLERQPFTAEAPAIDLLTRLGLNRPAEPTPKVRRL